MQFFNPHNLPDPVVPREDKENATNTGKEGPKTSGKRTKRQAAADPELDAAPKPERQRKKNNNTEPVRKPKNKSTA